LFEEIQKAKIHNKIYSGVLHLPTWQPTNQENLEIFKQNVLYIREIDIELPGAMAIINFFSILLFGAYK